jgi:hypothetical protein
VKRQKVIQEQEQQKVAKQIKDIERVRTIIITIEFMTDI